MNRLKKLEYVKNMIATKNNYFSRYILNEYESVENWYLDLPIVTKKEITSNIEDYLPKDVVDLSQYLGHFLVETFKPL